MLHHLPLSMHNDPFHFSSSSPDRLTPASYVATRPNPYTVKSQNPQSYTSLRTAAQSIPIDPRLGPTRPITTKSPLVHQHSSVDCLYSSLEAASRSPRCSSKPQTSPAKQYPLLTMVKPKSRPVKALTLSAELAAAKRLNCIKVASAAANKRRRNVVEAAKQQHTRSSASSAATGTSASRGRGRSQSPILSSSPLLPSTPQRPATQKRALQVPRITIRAPTPEPEPSIEQVLQRSKDADPEQKNRNSPLYCNVLLNGLGADLSNVEDGIDTILSKYFKIRKCARPICAELLRYLASSVCKLYSFVEDPESEIGQLKLRAISSQLFRHTITGFFHLLDDPLAPYGTASSLALFSAKVLRDFDTATEWCCRMMSGPVTSRAQQSLQHGQLFLNVLNDELDKILGPGLAMTDMDSRLALPGKGRPMFQTLNGQMSIDGATETSATGYRARAERAEMRKQRAQEGDEQDRFVGIDVVRFIGELALHEVIGISVLSKWLNRFLLQTVCLDIPSAWEIECACALLITVGSTLDHKPKVAEATVLSTELGAEMTSKASSSSSSSSSSRHANSEFETEDGFGWELLQKAMDRIETLVNKGDISPSAREWLVEVQQLRERGWNRDDDSDSFNEYLDSD
ncbi:uncharacterized protein UTRI_05008 [Ustilago trichophora]|uniref:MIF4G domain-containing protein n=1 Tax=Ustilago trichophora TaxID=86804 RepID=A0A5C3ECS7_9BASI|nr:uncharacterized protein UTRI_05008 [Ustilago trichophora]